MQTIALISFSILSTAFGGVNPEGPLWIQNGKLCLDLYGGRTQSGTAVQVYTCDYKATGQQWFFAPGTFKLVNVMDQTKCLDGTNMKSGTQLEIKDCDINTSQMWGYSTSDKTIYLESQAEQHQTVLCLDIQGSNFNDGTPVQLWQCNGKNNQNWQMATPTPPPKPYKINIASKNSCLDLNGQNTNDGTAIDVWTCQDGLKGQQWYFAPGTYRLQSLVDPKKCIDGGDMTERAKLTINDCKDGQASQTWGYDDKSKLIFLGSDIKNQNLCMCLTSFTDGSQLQLYDCKQCTGQWDISEVSEAEMTNLLQIV